MNTIGSEEVRRLYPYIEAYGNLVGWNKDEIDEECRKAYGAGGVSSTVIFYSPTWNEWVDRKHMDGEGRAWMNGFVWGRRVGRERES